jgi:glycine/D-amino acid oxidase-like deaminating enzyme
VQGNIKALLSGGERVDGVQLEDRSLQADAYVVSLGAYSPLLTRKVGIDLNWTHACGSGRALANIVSGRVPEIDFAFCRGRAGLAAAGRRQVVHREVGA